jgi:cell division FtsZ-interacting protein ZapD
MNQNGLSEAYYNACARMHEYVTAFYDEYMHTDEGQPVSDLETINKAIAELRQSMNIELDLIRELSKEHNE